MAREDQVVVVVLARMGFGGNTTADRVDWDPLAPSSNWSQGNPALLCQ
jgi:hypothetical protein